MEEQNKNRSYAVCGCSLVVVIVIFFFIGSCGVTSRRQMELDEQSERYQQAIEAAKQGNWEDVAVKLVRYKDSDTKCKVLYNYASAQRSYANNEFSMAKHYLKDIPDDYSGEFDNEIKQMKNMVENMVEKQVAEQKKQKEEQRKANEAEREKHLYIGDPEEKILKIWGEPDSVNRHVSEYGTRKQYVYHRGRKIVCIYTENGVVTAFQD